MWIISESQYNAISKHQSRLKKCLILALVPKRTSIHYRFVITAIFIVKSMSLTFKTINAITTKEFIIFVFRLLSLSLQKPTDNFNADPYRFYMRALISYRYSGISGIKWKNICGNKYCNDVNKKHLKINSVCRPALEYLNGFNPPVVVSRWE